MCAWEIKMDKYNNDWYVNILQQLISQIWEVVKYIPDTYSQLELKLLCGSH
jgi:hypothetical protein